MTEENHIQERQQRGNKRSDSADNDSGFGKVQPCTAAGSSARHFDVSTFEDWGIEAGTKGQTGTQSGVHIKYRSTSMVSTSSKYVFRGCWYMESPRC